MDIPLNYAILGYKMKITPLASKVASLCLCAPLFTSPFVNAQDSSDEPLELTVSYTANRFEQPKTSILAPMTVVTREQIELLDAKSAYDVLRTVPGVNVSSQGNKGNSIFLSLRGTGSNQTLVLIDGVRVNSATGGTASIGLIPAFAIERIEVIRGPRAAVYGSDAIGGVISITTLPTSNATQNTLDLNYGSNNYHSIGWKSSGQLSDRLFGSFVLNQEGDDGYQALKGNSEKFGYTSSTLAGSLSYEHNQDWSFGFNGIGQLNEDEYATENLRDVEFYSFGGFANFQQDSWNSLFSASILSEDSATGSQSTTDRDQKAILVGKRQQLSWINTVLPSDFSVLNIGIDYSRDEANREGSNSQDFSSTSTNTTGIFGTSVVELQALILEASIRYDDHSTFGGQTTWNLAGGYSLTDEVSLTGSAGTAYRAPTINDLYWPSECYDYGGGYISCSYGNPDLKPETSFNYEMSLNGSHQNVEWKVTYYNNTIEDMIEWAPVDGTNDWAPSNVAKAEIEGIEAEIGFSTSIVEHRLSADFKDPINAETGETLSRRAKQSYKWSATIARDNWTTAFITNYVGERFEANGDQLDSYFLADLTASYSFTDNLSISGRIDNIFDEEYSTAIDFSGEYIGQERSYYAGVNYAF
jgi:vitamin B12 transporter